MAVLSPAVINEDDKDENDEKDGHTASETRPVELEPRSACRLVNDLVSVGLLLMCLLICLLTFGPSHVASLFSCSFRAADRVMGPLGCCERVAAGSG